MRTRRTKLRIGRVEAKTGWRDARLVVSDVVGNEKREAVISIGHPYELADIRRKLNEIEESWRASLDAIRS